MEPTESVVEITPAWRSEVGQESTPELTLAVLPDQRAPVMAVQANVERPSSRVSPGAMGILRRHQ